MIVQLSLFSLVACTCGIGSSAVEDDEGEKLEKERLAK
jgi:hypothetical protein